MQLEDTHVTDAQGTLEHERRAVRAVLCVYEYRLGWYTQAVTMRRHNVSCSE